MNPDEMLKELGMSHAELHELLTKFHAFLLSLSEGQQNAIRRSLPTLAEAIKAFGPGVNAGELLKLFDGDEAHLPVILCLPGKHHRAVDSK
jgi:hypothetical protein